MQKNRSKSLNKNRLAARTFQCLWSLVTKNQNIHQKIAPNHKSDYIIDQKTDYFQQAPLFQEFLTYDNMICHNKIEYSNFVQISPEKINNKNLYECFHGILMYIFYYSGNKFNIEELEFHFTGGKSRKNVSQIINQNARNNIDHFNILNIFQYENIESQFQVNFAVNAFFGVTFKRIKINPICYSIRSGSLSNNTSHLVSFTFEGYDENNDCWDILDERVNINDLIPSGGFGLFYVRSTSKSYSSFKIRQIEPGSNEFWGFSIAAFDIHGIITLRDNFSYSLNSYLFDDQSYSLDFFNNDLDEINPTMDMAQYLD